jgi:hypothetical protein
MKKFLIALLVLMVLVPSVYAGQAPDVRISGYNEVVTSKDVIATNSIYATRLSQNTSQPCGMVYLCAAPSTVGVTWGGDLNVKSSVTSTTAQGVRLVGTRSCDTIYVDNVQDIWVSADTITANAVVSYTYYR